MRTAHSPGEPGCPSRPLHGIPHRDNCFPFRFGFALAVLLPALTGALPTALAAAESTGATLGPAIDFNRDIRPILSQNCIFCHGPDEAERKGGRKNSGGLRLDTQAGQREDLGGFAAVVPGKPDDSDLIRRVATHDPDDLMPPADSGKKLTGDQVSLLRRWVAAGARFSNHWAYERPVRPPLPPVPNPAWARTGIDRFILARLDQEGLRPQAEADRRTLARRLALDLTGLPPTVAEVEAFVSDPGADAYERFVDGLLAKPAYGEHWARMWLDLARYADSAGYADDPPRTMWPYRDYVIRAFNENLPFDQFTIEQLAGDLLPDPTEEQLKASAFHRNTMTNSEGGTNDEEFRNVAVVDRVNTTFAVWMGTSMACAQCHTHKYDPISQKEYFQLFAFLNNTADADRPDEAPLFEFDSEDVKVRRARIQQEFATLDARFREATPDLAGAADAWAAVFPSSLPWTTPRPSALKAESGAEFEILPDHSVLVRPQGTNVTKDTYTIDLPFDSETRVTAVRIEALSHPSLEGGGPGLAGNFHVRSVRAKILPVPNQAGPVARYVRIELPRKGIVRLAELQVFSSGENVARGAAASLASTRGDSVAAHAVDGETGGPGLAVSAEGEAPWFEVDLGSGRPVERIVLWPGSEPGAILEGFRIIALDDQRKPAWEKAGNPAPKKEVAFELTGPQELVFSLASADFNPPHLDEALVATDQPKSARYRKRGEKGWAVGGATGKDHALLLTAERPQDIPRGATLSVTIVQQASTERQALGRFRVGVSGDARAAEHIDTPPPVREALASDGAVRTLEQRALVTEYFVRHVAPGLKDPRERYAALQRERDGLKPLTVPVSRELRGKDRRTTRVQLRGNFLVTGEEVSEGVPAAWPPLPEGAPRDRLTLARWLVSAENPLTARVIANRFWEQIFGHGIVRTSEEFGSQGEPPVNQELLDWLATELVAGEWDMKRFLKLLVCSSAYRQSSRVTPEALEKDPDNRLLSRGPRFRLGAEMVRDQALAASGLLSDRLLGPSVRPPRPSLDLRAAFGGQLDWQTSPGEDRYRRGLYTEWRRTSPYPSMATFDAPSREVCTLRRNRSNTPLQALVTLNDPVYVEAAQALARRMIGAGDTLEARVRHGFDRVLARPPSRIEETEIAELLRDLQSDFAAAPRKAVALASGPGGAPSEGEAVELASWTAVANVLLNLDEALMKR